MKLEDRVYVEFFIFCGFIFANYLILLGYGIWFDTRPFESFRIRLAENLKEARYIPFYLWYGPYAAHLLARLGLFLWRRKRPKRCA